MTAKDYFQDITPPGGTTAPQTNVPPREPRRPVSEMPRESIKVSSEENESPHERSIRNLQITPTRRPRMGAEDMRESGVPHQPSSSERSGRSRFALWGSVAAALVVLAAIGLVALRPTTVGVVPRSHNVLFDESARFIAYPVASAATGTLSFTIETQEFEDSQTVPAQGIERVEDRAQGTVTVFNNYSAAPVKLIKNTRFQTPQGLVFRAPAEVMVPGKKGNTPGQVAITVFADKAGEQYNVASVDKFTLPGLASTPAMYKGVYARSTAAMSGGFVGERAAASPAALEAARSEIRSRIEEKIRAAVSNYTSATAMTFADLAHLTFESVPPVTETAEKVRVGERARVEFPIFSNDTFAYIIGQSVTADAEQGGISLVPEEGFTAQSTGATSSSIVDSPLSFTLRGQALLVWKINTGELQKALAGREEGAFQTIVQGFPGIEEAHARIQPFWKNTFPITPEDIKIRVDEPKPGA